MDWVPGLTWGWLGPSGSLCNEHRTNSPELSFERVEEYEAYTEPAGHSMLMHTHTRDLVSVVAPTPMPMTVLRQYNNSSIMIK
jgi:hypothetical protein